MKTLKRNQSPFYYCLYQGVQELVDEYGNFTGEYAPIYTEPIRMSANVSPATGQSTTEQFGNLENYDKVIVTDWMECPIDESSVLFIDKEPEFADGTSHSIIEATALFGEDEIVPTTFSEPVYDYIVRRVAKSLNSVSIAVGKVQVS